MSICGENGEKSKDFMKTAPSYDFSDSKIKHDIVLLVEETKFHVSSEYLVMWSEYFESLFGPNFKDASVKELEIKEVAAEDFTEFLKFIYPSHAKIDEKNVVALIKMAHRFLAPGIMVECQNFIDEFFDKIDIFELLEISIKYEITDLKEKIGCLIYVSPAKATANYRCTSCKFGNFDDRYCKHPGLGAQIMVNTFIDENSDRLSKLSFEAQLYSHQASAGKYKSDKNV